jgi:D-tyrosyl-tRNA(Tyr) deacylase
MVGLVQVVNKSECIVDGKIVSKIKKGLLVYLGVGIEDNIKDEIYLATKISKLRVFADAAGKINQSIKDVEGHIMVISNFTLYGDTAKNNRPSFINAATYDEGLNYYNSFCKRLEELTGIKVQKGVFGADMRIVATQIGPTNIIINTKGKHYN